MSNRNIILKAENISKQYRLGTVGTGTLSHDLNRFWHKIRGKEDPYLKVGEVNDRSSKGTSEYVWALKDINFEVEAGEVLGIIGKNGAGKSTLLKILSKVTAPTTGSIKSRGRIASLLEVGTGFNPELTGRENIYLNGAILGMTKKEITSKLDEIIEFSGCERYIDTPTKRYSSGMTVRLAFAVAAFLEPEILVVDEVLAVGDAEFQKKAIGKMQSISREGGRTVLFVSHNMMAVKSLCTRGIVLENGMVVFEGNINECVDRYSSVELDFLKEECKHNSYYDKVKITDPNITIGEKIIGHGMSINLGDKLNINFKVNVFDDISELFISMDILNVNSELIAHITNEDDGISFQMLKKNTMIEINVKTESLLMVPGMYRMNLWVGSVQIETLYTISNFLIFQMEQSDFTKRTKELPKHSKMYLPTIWETIN
ncbi:ABC transporter ATP-binding protein [uncultured Flavobacterium sp.]|uniref:ABC transporter ATP-binding protein n=1 Tax=uncultured Flavobacterium sp. TaxID=165435 RepID=UPI0030EDFB25|tara:strand:- start:27027 stop:28313 length:1287 start_codon:yes stop_codon:yes gene_type:complete